MRLLSLWEWFAALMLGCVEGLTEFVPVSSTGHMIIVDDLWFRTSEMFSAEVAVTFKIVIQLGSVLAVVVLMRERFLNLLGLQGGQGGETGERRLKLTQVVAGLIPAGAMYLLLNDWVDRYLFSTETVVIGLVLGAILMMAADRFRPRQPKTETVDQITYRQAILVGCFQCLAMWPGFSRSGSTISGGVLLGMSHRAAADFTFIMAVPIMAGVSFFSLLKNWSYLTPDVLPFLATGFVSAFVVALISIRFFLKLVHRIKLVPFALYRLALAAVIYFIVL
ncbi:undecaprenyl-diphosphate phosphatase [Paenibacillus puerhi]|uniref:undecaprenyl-diphosphate phosphatase n=1 Tax=Paenibacillus puerhi TaxID=2692622 RepID=UPI0019163864|nr:undecaprenyl-diphosphate phosphatase [Paenibacillus puerhi]